MMSFSKTITDDQVVAIGRKFGELRNYICTNKKDSVTHYLIYFFSQNVIQAKGWLQFEEHKDAYQAMEKMGNKEILHENTAIIPQT